MRELALNILDISENSVKAGASLVEIHVEIARELLVITITDDGCGMKPEFLAKVRDPFTTTRTTRKVGMGIPLFEMAAEMSGGALAIDSKVGVGTTVRAVFQLAHIDRPPLGNVADAVVALLSESGTNGGKLVDFFLRYRKGKKEFTFDTRELRQELGEEVPLDSPEVLGFVKSLIEENSQEINGGAEI